MIRHRRSFASRLTVAVAAMLVVAATTCMAAPVTDTCTPEQVASQQKMSDAKVSESKAIDDQVFNQDDSVLALTCFNQTAALMGQQGGKVFSGDFRALVAPAVETTLQTTYLNFHQYTLGYLTAQVNYGDSAVKMDVKGAADIEYKCKEMDKLWNAVNNQGVDQGSPVLTQKELTDPAARPVPATPNQHDDSLNSTTSTTAQTGAADAVTAVQATQKPVSTGCKCKTSTDTSICYNSISVPTGWDKATACP